MTHELKILPKWFDDVSSGKKNFELRKNDRSFQVGDELLLKEWYRGEYTGRKIRRKIEYIYFGDGTYGLSDGYCILGFASSPQIQVNQYGGSSRYFNSVDTLIIK